MKKSVYKGYKCLAKMFGGFCVRHFIFRDGGLLDIII